MLFNSNEFLLVFLPLSLAGFHLTRFWYGKTQAFTVLLLFSFLFYGWWDWRYLPLLLISLVVNLLLSAQLQKWPSKLVLTFGIGFNLGLIAVFKYLGFIELNIEALTGSRLGWPEFILPVGISFYTFQQIAFLVDTFQLSKSHKNHRNTDSKGRNHPVRYGLFVCFFPQLIAGPIVHHKEMMSQFESPPPGHALMRMAACGLFIFAIGLAKKTMIADPLGAFASPFFNRPLEGGEIHFFIAWAASLAYTFQIYFDFCGYSEMALGIALMFGVRLPTNFNSPYKARSIIDFWRRWHMTLSRFLRDYVYFPLGGNRSGKLKRYRNLMIVMLVGGLWHGASWTFVLWGGLHGIFLIINHGWHYLKKRSCLNWMNQVVDRFAWPLTFFAVVMAWVTFRSDNIDTAWQFYSAMLGMKGFSFPVEAAPVFELLNLQNDVHLFAENYRKDFYIGLIWVLMAALIAFFSPSTLQLLKAEKPTSDYENIAKTFPVNSISFPHVYQLKRWGALVVGILLYVSLRSVNAASETEFLYFQF